MPVHKGICSEKSLAWGKPFCLSMLSSQTAFLFVFSFFPSVPTLWDTESHVCRPAKHLKFFNFKYFYLLLLKSNQYESLKCFPVIVTCSAVKIPEKNKDTSNATKMFMSIDSHYYHAVLLYFKGYRLSLAIDMITFAWILEFIYAHMCVHIFSLEIWYLLQKIDDAKVLGWQQERKQWHNIL